MLSVGVAIPKPSLESDSPQRLAPPQTRTMAIQFVSRLAIPAVVLLIGFISYASQLLFRGLEPGPLKSRDSIQFNILVLCIWICYVRACAVDPGHIPSDWTPEVEIEVDKKEGSRKAASRQRVCRKCNALKAPRSHHCKICQRYAQVSHSLDSN